MADLYSTPPDFHELAEAYPPLKPHVFVNSAGHPAVNFKDIEAQRRLAEALLARDFRLSLTLPQNRLCPAIPNRLNYVRWIQTLVSTLRDPRAQTSTALGLDIGTGASAIYPLLACTLETTWSMIGTDVDDVSISYARTNVLENSLQHRIEIRPSSVDGAILHPLSDPNLPRFDFTMCNPPFYSSHEDVVLSAKDKEFDPHAVCTGSENEMITPGGEVQFVRRMYEESLQLRSRCRWFTTLLGKLSSVTAILAILKEAPINGNYAVTEFIQGHTRRWGIGWSFDLDRLPDRLAHATSSSLHGLMPLPTTLHQSFKQLNSPSDLEAIVDRVLHGLSDLSFTRDDNNPSILPSSSQSWSVSVTQNSWSRAARRKKLQDRSTVSSSSVDSQDVLLRCRILVVPVSPSSGPTTLELCGQWTYGSRHADWESFWSHVTRKVAADLVA